MTGTAEKVDSEGGSHRPDPDQPARPVLLVVLAAVAAATIVLGFAVLVTNGELGRVVDPGPSPAELVAGAVESYLEEWSDGDYDAMAELVLDPPPDFAERHRQLLGDLLVEEASYRSAATRIDGDRASVDFHADLELAGLGPWSYQGRLELVLAEVPVVEEPGAEVDGLDGLDGPEPDPDLEPPTEEAWRVMWQPATVHPALLDDGRRLVLERTWPERGPILAADGTPLTGSPPAGLAVLGAQVVGRVGPADEERAEALGSPYLEGDIVGLSGLHAAHERHLAGAPAGRVLVVSPEGEQIGPALAEMEGADPRPLQTTIDLGVQAAAEGALTGGAPAALVAIQASTGEVRAVVSRPAGGFERALRGSYPPGSTFKVVTTFAALAHGVDPSDILDCPATTAVGGRRFSNAGNEELGAIPFSTVFTRSCNTAFVRIAADLDGEDLVAAAERFGFNSEPQAGLPAAAPSFPEPDGVIERAAQAIGQGRILVSPLYMATVPAAVASGAWRPPTLVARDEPVAGEPLDLEHVGIVQDLMRRAVADGTGTAAQLPGEPVAGKTGTAEYGTAVPPRTHAWFVGYRGDLAFAVVVEGAGFGGTVAAPIARDFLARVGG